MRVYLVRFAKLRGMPQDESLSEKELDEVGKVQAERTAKFLANKKIHKIYIDEATAGEKTAAIIKKELKEHFSEEKIPKKEESGKLERVKMVAEKIKEEGCDVLIISSSDFITSFILYMLNLSQKEKKYFRVKTCSVSIMELNESGEVINFSVNDYSHLLRFSPYYKIDQ